MSNVEPKSPLTIIAIFAGIIEASALASLPFLSEESQTTYTWFLVGFPFFLTVLFFLTLNFNYKSLYSHPVIDPADTSAPPELKKPSIVADTSIDETSKTPMKVTTSNEIITVPIEATPPPAQKLEKPAQNTRATVTITLSGASASQLLERLAVQAVNQAQPLCNTWVLYNLDTGTRITLATHPSDT